MSKIIVKGIYNHKIGPIEFIGNIDIEKTEKKLYFTWEIKTLQGEFIAMKGGSIPHRIIPANINSIDDFILDYVIHSINKYRMLRKKVFEIQEYYWDIIK